MVTDWAKYYAGSDLTGTPGDSLWLRDNKGPVTEEVARDLACTEVWVCTFISEHNPQCAPVSAAARFTSSCLSESSGPSSASTLYARQAGYEELSALPSTSRAMKGPDANYYALQVEVFGHKQGVDVWKWTDADLASYLSRLAPNTNFPARTL